MSKCVPRIHVLDQHGHAAASVLTMCFCIWLRKSWLQPFSPCPQIQPHTPCLQEPLLRRCEGQVEFLILDDHIHRVNLFSPTPERRNTKKHACKPYCTRYVQMPRHTGDTPSSEQEVGRARLGRACDGRAHWHANGMEEANATRRVTAALHRMCSVEGACGWVGVVGTGYTMGV